MASSRARSRSLPHPQLQAPPTAPPDIPLPPLPPGAAPPAHFPAYPTRKSLGIARESKMTRLEALGFRPNASGTVEGYTSQPTLIRVLDDSKDAVTCVSPNKSSLYIAHVSCL